MHLKYESTLREPLVDGEKNYHQVTEDIISPIEGKPGKLWYVGFFISVALLLWGVFSVTWEVYYGTGVWNLNKTIGWGWDITNFVWWVGIGHAGTLISAILLLFRQGWRTGVNRAAEAMTIFAVMCAGQFPIFHMGRVWMAFFVLPYPNTRGPLWVNFNSPLLWDVFAISTYFTVSLLFWYSGLLPDFATVRDRAKTKLRKLLYGVASFGWTGSAKHWQRHEALSLVLAGLSTPLVLSVHTIVSFDFATSVIPGWHTTIFPPYFVAGAIFSGFAMVNTLLIIVRKVLGLEDYITMGHMEAMNKVIVLTGSVVGCAYLTELFMAWYAAVPYEFATFYKYRAAGPLGWSYWIMMTCNVITPQVFWFRKMRRNIVVTFVMSIIVNIGMWFERFVIICTSLYRDYLPSSWSYYRPSWPEVGFYMGTFGLFFTCFFLFAKYFPVIAVAEIKFVLKTSGESFKRDNMEKLEPLSAEEFEHIAHSHHDDDHGHAGHAVAHAHN
ncbi:MULTISPECIES: NrfD/PsrC family molybdoenzyme membrane anchor subunit [unclassified Chitinophaga]|uniref:NrfD/PsrC family molybdoenzyme membrane anchor subunit n=1 Tax=unclassified Chitinophaga TaxID=2619133 RepID=UPI0009CF8A82|nr:MULTISPECIES: NrfD/PsrC family molybdoenzyme membrane anchor subunit [unclassified Chitinophaga]OMP78792.1 hydrogenase [[Flexibacter] sp. ATCC 35208]WPV68482.1 polysulfide reductase NrfD [Chitinophaga sp. LS1]